MRGIIGSVSGRILALLANLCVAMLLLPALEGAGKDGTDPVRRCRERCTGKSKSVNNACFKACIGEEQRGADRGGRDSDYAACEARCAPVQGEARSRCVRQCVSARKRNAPSGEGTTKKKMSFCESACGERKGLERIRCIRLCMDGKTPQ